MSKAGLKGNPLPYDQSMIPPAARRAAEAAEAMIKGAQQPAAPEPAPAPAPVVSQDPPAAPQPAPEPAPAPAPAPVVSQDPPAAPEGVDWQHRFESEAGRTKALRKDLDEANARIADMSRLLATMQVSTPAQPVPSELTFEPKKYVTKEEEEEWTPELLTVVGKRAQEIAEDIVAKSLKPLQDEIKRLGGSVENVGKKMGHDAYQEMLRTLDGNDRIKGWREINEDPNFVAWVKKIDPMAGQVRQDMMLSAWKSNDASRVAAFFENWIRETNPAPRQEAQPSPASPKPSLEQFAAPGAPRSAAPSATGQDDKPFFTRAEISDFFVKRAAGKWPGTEAEAKVHESRIFAAEREGRIR